MSSATEPVSILEQVDIDEARRRARKGPRQLLASRLAMLAITFLSTVTIARLVAPREYGLAAMSTVIFTFVQIFRDFGVTNAVLRKGHILKQELALIFWFNVGATTVLSLLLIGLAPVVAAFYHEPIVLWTMLVSVIGFQIGGVALQHRALINRELRFGVIAWIDVIGLAVGFVVTLILALVRHDVWALVIGTVSQAVTSAVLAIVLSGWRPTRPTRGHGLGDLIRFGANTTVHALSVLISNNIAVVIIGALFGAGPLGQYNRAQTLFFMTGTNVIRPMTQSTMPLLTRLRVQPADYRDAYLGLVRRLCVLLMPLSVTFAFIALPLTRLLLGDRWHAAGLVLTALAPTLAFIGLAYAVADVFITQDRSADLRNLGLVELVLRVGGIIIGAQFGLVATAAGYAVSTILVTIIRVFVAGRQGPVTTRDQWAAGATGVLPALGAALACSAVFFLAAPRTELWSVLGPLAAGVLGAALGGLCTRTARRTLHELADSYGLAKVGWLRRRRRRRAG
jgi:polysaccharide transporter, PST family